MWKNQDLNAGSLTIESSKWQFLDDKSAKFSILFSHSSSHSFPFSQRGSLFSPSCLVLFTVPSFVCSAWDDCFIPIALSSLIQILLTKNKRSDVANYIIKLNVNPSSGCHWLHLYFFVAYLAYIFIHILLFLVYLSFFPTPTRPQLL